MDMAGLLAAYAATGTAINAAEQRAANAEAQVARLVARVAELEAAAADVSGQPEPSAGAAAAAEPPAAL